mmetsp:Transcript_17169/g.59694  ORF Transcript_17169/g.59694 Transcript_17169/m.59694 type:complete len:214 (-) Transcript_17169:14-655(-)
MLRQVRQVRRALPALPNAAPQVGRRVAAPAAEARGQGECRGACAPTSATRTKLVAMASRPARSGRSRSSSARRRKDTHLHRSCWAIVTSSGRRQDQLQDRRAVVPTRGRARISSHAIQSRPIVLPRRGRGTVERRSREVAPARRGAGPRKSAPHARRVSRKRRRRAAGLPRGVAPLQARRGRGARRRCGGGRQDPGVPRGRARQVTRKSAPFP